VTSRSYDVVGVRLGEYDLSTGQDCVGGVCNDVALDVDIESIIPYDNYRTHLEDDIALIRLAISVVFTDFIRPLCLPVDDELIKFNYTGVPLTVSGWGKI
jgi:Trypsin